MAWQIKTYIEGYYISTAWVEGLGAYETMVFKRWRWGFTKEDEVNWDGELIGRTESKEKAIKTHCEAIRSYMK